jgi:hypothetical protein
MDKSREEILERCLELHVGKFKKMVENFKKGYISKYSQIMKKIIDKHQNEIDTTICRQLYKNKNEIINELNMKILELNVFSFTYPLLACEEEDTIIKLKYDFYKMIEVNDEIFIYKTISKDNLLQIPYNNVHLGVMIKTSNGYVFSFGLVMDERSEIVKEGLFDFTTVKKAKIITPDKFLEYKLNYQIENMENDEEFVKLIAKTKLTRTHITNLTNIFKLVNYSLRNSPFSK